MTMDSTRGQDESPGVESPAPAGGVINFENVRVQGDLQVASRDARKDRGDRSGRPWSSWSLVSQLVSVVGGFVISVVAGFVVYFWTVDDGGDRPDDLGRRDAPVTTETTAAGEVAPTAEGTVRGCNTYGENCDGNPIYERVPPPPDYDWAVWPTIARVPNGTTLRARCWALGAVTTNYAETDHGPDPYASGTYFNVQAPDGRWGWIPDTYFVRDEANRMGLPKCSDTGGPGP